MRRHKAAAHAGVAGLSASSGPRASAPAHDPIFDDVVVTRQRPHVVVVGASFAGLHLVRGLDTRHFRVTLVDSKPFVEYTPGILRSYATGSDPMAHMIPVRDCIDPASVRFICANVTAMTLNHNVLSLELGADVLSVREELKYDVCVLATGSSYRGWKCDVGLPTVSGRDDGSGDDSA